MRRIQRGSQTKASLTEKESRLESIELVKLIYYARSTAPFLSKLCSNYARFNIILDNKMGKTVRKVSFITLLHYYHSSPGLVCCFCGFKYTVSSKVNSFGSLQDLKVLELYFRGGGHHLVTLSHLWEWKWEQGFLHRRPFTLRLKSVYHYDTTVRDTWAWF